MSAHSAGNHATFVAGEAGVDERPSGATSLHSRIIAEIEAKILDGEWPPGRRIPYEHELTELYGCSRMTVSKALTELARAGLIERRRKAGSFVTRPQVQSALLEIRDVASDVAALGLPYRFEALARKRRRATRAGPRAHRRSRWARRCSRFSAGTTPARGLSAARTG